MESLHAASIVMISYGAKLNLVFATVEIVVFMILCYRLDWQLEIL